VTGAHLCSLDGMGPWEDSLPLNGGERRKKECLQSSRRLMPQNHGLVVPLHEPVESY
jgi:hypothetical protein